jgi:hypothetical protein
VLVVKGTTELLVLEICVLLLDKVVMLDGLDDGDEGESASDDAREVVDGANERTLKVVVADVCKELTMTEDGPWELP